ncbi:N-acetylmuramoyl-L-alanine amidase [Paenibacillus sp. SYP-B3998]|uniref:N-acetylmuramoyl-L-alanine amidase n=2 Tax=Paenibacillus sp. SYP-B3998 TaxID=2678564 RepID=A0A6G3ZSF2_9BACL|nr:N-acetylmuramoyl-L-alanine amidase [Paenibacillus sp. SYP-B3998]
MRRSWLAIAIIGFLIIEIGSPVANAKAPDQPIICVDPGHQRYGNNGLEPTGPDAKEMKPKVSSGTRGVKTKKPEYVLSLEAALLIKDKLEKLGYQVVMTRETHDVNISNKERALMCNEVNADLAVRLHADGDSSAQTQGISLLTPAWSEHNKTFYSQSKEAAQSVLNEVLKTTGAASRGIVARSDLSGFNWSEVPTILVEMGFMTNSDEDEKLSNPDYLDRLAQGVVNGINVYGAVQVEGTEKAQQAHLYLPTPSRLYELLDGKMIRTAMSLTPQTVQASASWGNWHQVDTWVGSRWVYTGPTLIEIQRLDKELELSNYTAMYRSPLDEQPIGGLTPQKVRVKAQWQRWYMIETWQGDAWILQK